MKSLYKWLLGAAMISAPAIGVFAADIVEYKIYAQNQTGWDNMDLYMWGNDSSGENIEPCGGWSGMSHTGTSIYNGTTYQVYVVEAEDGYVGNLIFNGDGNQVEGKSVTFSEGGFIYLDVTASDITEVDPQPAMAGDITYSEPEPEIACVYTVYADNQTNYDDLHLYVWGDNELLGGWPGKASIGTSEYNGVSYLVFQIEGYVGYGENLIFNSPSSGGWQKNGPYVKLTEDGFIYVTVNEDSDATVLPEQPTEPGVIVPNETENEPTPGETYSYTIYAYNNAGWDGMSLYAWGDEAIFGDWPGIAPSEATVKVGDYDYYVFSFEAEGGLSENLIFNNNGNGSQTQDFNLTLPEEDTVYYFEINASNAVLIADPADFTPSAPEEVYPLYVIGSFNNWNAYPEYGMVQDLNDLNVYSATFTVYPSDEISFKIGSKDWSEYNIGGEAIVNFQVNENEITEIDVINDSDSQNLVCTNWEGGEMTVTLDLGEMKVYVCYAGTSDVNRINTENAANVIYNLQGVRVNGDNLPSGIYIINGKKVAVRK